MASLDDAKILATASSQAFGMVKSIMGLDDYDDDAAAAGILYGFLLTHVMYRTTIPQQMAADIGDIMKQNLSDVTKATGEAVPT